MHSTTTTNLTAASRNRRARAILATVGWLAACALAAPAAAQVPGTDCGCAETGPYLDPDPGVAPRSANAVTGLSPGGRYRLEITSPPGQTPATLDVVRVSDGARLLANATGATWGFSPDDDRFVIGFFVGSPPNQQFEHALYDLAGGVPAPRIWNDGPSPWASLRIRFSEDGSVFLFAGHQQDLGTSLALLEVASRSLYTTSFLTASPPGWLEDETAVARWGFGPDPTRFAYSYVSNSGVGTTEFGRLNVATRVGREDTFTANSLHGVFSPCGDAFAFVVKQLATSDLTDVTLFGTRDPLAAPLGVVDLPFPALEVQATATQHVAVQGGVPTVIAANGAGDACSAANLPPEADFDPPAALQAGTPGAFTDASSDADGTLVAWLWEFGDGTTSTVRHPAHAYAVAGSYRVRLTVTDDDGATDFAEGDVTVCGDLGALGGRLLYSNALDGDLRLLDVADGTTVRLTNSDESYTEPRRDGRFSPDGTRIVYGDEGVFVAGIWVMNADGSGRRRLTDGGGSRGLSGFHGAPDWSPDAAWIAYRDEDVETPANQGLWMVRTDGSARTQIPGTTRLDFQPDFVPELAPGCSAVPPEQRGPGCYTLVISRTPAGGGSVSLVQLGGDGSGVTTIATSFSFGFHRLSPGGDLVAYSRIDGTGPLGLAHRIFTVPRAGGLERQITQGGDEVFTNPVWSPDGGALAYAESVGGVPSTILNFEIGVTDAGACHARGLLSQPAHDFPLDWATGRAVQGLGSIEGQVGLDSGFLTTVPGAIVELTGDVTATATTDAQGTFRFENIPIGANVTLRFVSAPGHVAFPAVPPSFTNFSGHAVAVKVIASPAEARITGAVREEPSLQPLEGVTVTATGPGGPIQSTTDASGAYALTIQNHQTYTIAPSKPGYRFEPPSVSGTMSNGILEFRAIRLPPPGRIAFVTNRFGSDEIWSVGSDGQNAYDLLWGEGVEGDPTWSPDGLRLAYTSDDGAGPMLWIWEPENDEEPPIDLGVLGREPAWSPDGTALVFASDAGLARIDLGSFDVTPLTTAPSDASPAFRPDGASVVFERSGGDGTTDLFEVFPALGFEAPLVTNAGDDRDPAFAAIGGGFAYATQGGDVAAPLQIRVEFPFEAFESAACENPSWSGDGSQLACDRDGTIYRVDPRNGTAVPLSEEGDRDPTWQPVGEACANGLDDDGDGFTDLGDPGCADAADASERGPLACDDGLDDDGDGLADLDDPGCPFPFATFEDPLCDNGLDDDGDGLVDADDPMCTPGWPYREAACGLGAELVAVLGSLRLARRRRSPPA